MNIDEIFDFTQTCFLSLTQDAHTRLHFFSRLVTYCLWTQLSKTWEWFSSLIRFDRIHPDSVFSDPRILMNRTLNNSFKWLMPTSVLAEQNASAVVAVVVVVVVGSLLWIVKMGLWYFVIEASPSSPETETKWTFCTPNLIVPSCKLHSHQQRFTFQFGT